MQEKMKVKTDEVRKELTRATLRERLRELRSLVLVLNGLVGASDTLQSLPDVFVWIVQAGERIAYARVPAREILNAQSEALRGIEALASLK